jgi:hypothetical protein
VNDDTDVPTGGSGWAFDAVLDPAWALLDMSNQPGSGDTCGPSPGTWTIAGGLPGFICLALDSTHNRVLVIRDQYTRILNAKATTKWNAAHGTIQANPMIQSTTMGFAITIQLPQLPGNQDYNIQIGDTIRYLWDSVDGAYVAMSGIDAKLGTIIQRAAAFNATPAGWALMDGTENSIANGGSGVNMKDKFIRGAGGAAAATGGNPDAAAINLADVAVVSAAGTNVAFETQTAGLSFPEWRSLYFYERIS